MLASKYPRQTTPIKVTHSRHVAANSTRDFKMGARFIARSIPEQTKKSVIVIASRVYENPQIFYNRIDNTNTIEKYAREAQL
jgi:hypothetical protein